MSFETTVEPIIDSLRSIACSDASSTDSPSPSPSDGALLARLKAINRRAFSDAQRKRELTAEARTAVTAVNLGLENLMYEKRHLEREIEKCRQFAVIYQDVPLHSVDEFMVLAPPDMPTKEVAEDEHQLMLHRLRFELSVRQQLEERRKALVQERDTILSDTKRFQDEVDKLSDPFDRLNQTALEIQRMIRAIVPSPQPPTIALPPPQSPKDESMEDGEEKADGEDVPSAAVTVTAPTAEED